MTVTPSRIEIIEGESAVLSASVSPEAASDRAVAWSSSDLSVATVDKAGTVHGLRPGTATVTATAEGKSGTCAVTVKAKAVNVTGVTLDVTELTLTEGEAETLTATVKPDNADNKKVAWSSDKTDVATVDGAGRVTAVKAGEAVVTVTTEDGGKTATCKVTVKAKAVGVTEVTLDRAELTLTEGEAETLTATVRPDNADNRKVTWSSDKTEVATVDGAGKVTAVKAGEAVVTVMTEDGGKTASCKVTVKAKAVGVTEVTLDRAELTLTEGEAETLTATVRPDNADNRKVTWSSDKTEVATVDGAGKVTAVKAGEAVVTVMTEDGGKTASCKVTVKAKVVPVTGADVKPWSVTIGANSTTKLTCTVAPSNATNRNVRWESDNPSVAKVSAVTEDGGFRSGCTVTVKEFSSGFEVGGLFYKTAEGYSIDFVEVTGNPGGGKYSGDVVVPGTVEYDGITYTVKGVGNRAFEGCDDLRKVTISEGIYKIGAYAFYYSGNLERVILPSTLENIDDSNPVFEACSKLEIITTAPREGQENYCYLYDKALYMHVGRTEREILSWIPEKKTGTVVIKEGTTKIGYSSIHRTNVDKIVIPESVKSIDIYTFVSCKTPLVLELNWKTKEDVDEITTKMSSFFFNGTDRSAVKVTVPKGTKSYYESHWLWSNLGGIEERP